MSGMNNVPYYKRIWKIAPAVFPWIGIFHVVLLLRSIWSYYIDEPIGGWILIQPVIMLLYTIAWLFVCDMKKWAGLAYLALTSINLLLRFLVSDASFLNSFTDTLFPADILFTFFVMFYFKRFN